MNEEGFERFRARYQRAGRKEKGQMLTHFCQLTGCHRKHAIRALGKREPGRPANPERRGRKSRYGTPDFVQALKLFYRATDRMCSRLLKGAIPDWMAAVEKRHGAFSDEVRKKLLVVSSATIERLLRQHKAKFPKAKCGTKPGTIKREQIQIRRGIWEETVPGFMESDTVAHCGTSMMGTFAWTLDMTDIATHWTECRAVWHKGAKGVLSAIRDVEKALPFDLMGFDCDNGGEFINRYLIQYFTKDHPRRHIIQFTRSREYHKNDNAHVEQRNWSHPRQLFFRERIDFYQLIEIMNDIYRNEFSLLRNHFYPTLKLDRKVLVLSRYRRIYGDAKTPYLRVIESPAVSERLKAKLRAVHEALDPIELRHRLDAKLRRFWAELKRLRLVAERDLHESVA